MKHQRKNLASTHEDKDGNKRGIIERWWKQGTKTEVTITAAKQKDETQWNYQVMDSLNLHEPEYFQKRKKATKAARKRVKTIREEY